MLHGIEVGGRLLLIIDNEIDVTLTPERDIFRSMIRHMPEPHHLKYRLEQSSISCRVLDKFKPVQPHGVVKQVSHGFPLLLSTNASMRLQKALRRNSPN